jgi:hypothetical protein
MRWLITSVLALGISATAVAEVSISEFHARRKEAIKRLPDGILLLHAQPGLRLLDQSTFHQDATFYYFTGLESAINAILAIDGAAGESWLFVPSKLRLSISTPAVLKKATVPVSSESAALLRIEHVVDWLGKSLW